MRATTIKHKFVTTLPEVLENGVLYVAMDYRTAVHKCCCGCGSEVATTLSPTDWKLIYDGVSVSLFPSIGNWSLDCQSHYWIERNNVEWAGKWTKEEVDAGRAYDRSAKERYFGRSETPKPARTDVKPESSGVGAWFKKWFD